VSHIAKLLFDKIENVLLKIGSEKFVRIVSDNTFAIAAIR